MVPLVPSFKPCKVFNFGLLNVSSINNKTASINEYIVDNNVDMMALTETLLMPDDTNGFVLLILPHQNCTFSNMFL